MAAICIRLCLTASAFALPAAAAATETTTYTYDPLGRLVASSSAGTVNNGVGTAVAYDASGNRSTYASGPNVGGGAPPNQPPTTVADTASVPRCGSVVKDVLANDSDPDGNNPLALVDVAYTGTRGAASIASSTSVEFDANPFSGAAVVTYWVRDSLGSVSSGTLTVSVTTVYQC